MEQNKMIRTEHEVTVETLDKFLQAAGLARSLTEGEREQFVQICLAFGLNPFKKEIHASKYGNQMSIIVGYETYLKRAERTGLLDSWFVEVTGEINRQSLRQSSLEATITIKRKDRETPFKWSVLYSEYLQTTRDGQVTKFWAEKPVTMLKKVAISQGFRLCFPEDVGGLPYTAEEGDSLETTIEQIKEDKEIVAKTWKRIDEKVEEQYQEAIHGEPEEVEIIDEEKSFNEAKAAILDVETKEDLVTLWKSFPELQTNEEFISLIKERRAEIESGSEEEEPEEITEDLRSKNYGVDLARKLVRRCLTLEQLNQFVDQETRKSVLKIFEECRERFVQKSNLFE